MISRRIFYISLCSICFLFLTAHLTYAEPSIFTGLSEKDKTTVDTIIDVFKRHHMIFKSELSDANNLVAATGVLEIETGDRYGRNHDHSGKDISYQTEHLASIIVRATPDADGKFLTPTVTPLPGVTYTFKELYTVTIAPRLIRVGLTRAEEGKKERIQREPNKEFIRDLAERFQGKVISQSIILP